MGFFWGATLGLGAHVYSNALRKAPLLSRPWEHLLAIGIGGVAGAKFSEWHEWQTKELDVMLQEKGRTSVLFPTFGDAVAKFTK